MSKSQHLKIRIPSSIPVMNRKSENVQKNNAPSIPRRCASNRGNWRSSSSGSKRCGRLDTSESDINDERMGKKHKPLPQVTMEAENSKVHTESVVSKTEKLTGRRFKFLFKRVREEETVSGREPLLGEEGIDKEASNVDRGRSPIQTSNLKNVKSTNEESSAQEEDQEHIPLEQKLAQEVNSADTGNFVKEVQEKCDKRMKKLNREQNGKIQEFHRSWKDNISKLEREYKLEAAIVRSIHGKSATTIDKLKILDDNFAKKMAENILLKDMQLKELEEKQLAVRNEEIQKAASWLSKAKEVEENIDSSRTVKGNHVVRSDTSDCATAEEVACNSRNGNPSSTTNDSQKNEGGISSDIPILAVVQKINQPKHLGAGGSIFANLPASGKKVPGEMQLLELHGDVPSELPATVANENVVNANSVNVSANTPLNLPDAEHLGSGEKTFPNVPASGERVPGEVQSHELYGAMLELPETVADEIVDNANPVDLSTNSPIEGFGEGDAIDLPDAEHLTQPKHFGLVERTIADLPASGERFIGDMQSLELCKDIPEELAETDAHEIVDNNNPVELNADTSIKGFCEGDAIDLPDALLNQRNETDRTTIDDLDLDRQVLKTSERTKASQHPCPMLPLRVREDQDAVSVEIQGHGVQVVGKVNSSPSELVATELVATARNSLSNIEPQAREEPAIETQSSSRTEVSTSKIIDTVIAEQPFIKLQDRDTSAVKEQVTYQIEAADSERVDTAATVAASELVTAKTLDSNNKFQHQVETAIETQSSENPKNASPVLSSTERQDEDGLIVTNQANLEIEVSNSGLADNTTPVQPHIGAPPIESDAQLQLMLIDASPNHNRLPAPELDSQNHNLRINSSAAAETEMLSHESPSRQREDLESQINFLDFRPESQPSLATSVQISASVQNNIATEAVLRTSEIPQEAILQLGGVSHLPSDQVSPSLLADPLQNELQKIHKETERLEKSLGEMMVGLESECRKQMQELVDEVSRKYQLKFQEAQAQYALKHNGLIQKHEKILMNKLLADAFNFNCLNTWSTWPLMQQGFPSSSMQYHQQLVRPAGATAPNPQIARLNGQSMQQISPPNSTRIGPITSQHIAAPSVQAAQLVGAISRLWHTNGVHPMSLPHFGGDIYSSALQFQASIPTAAPSMPNATLISSYRNLQQQQQPLAAPHWPSNSHNPQIVGYPPAVPCTSLSSLELLMDVEPHHRHHLHHRRLPGVLQGNNQTSYARTASAAICLSDDD